MNLILGDVEETIYVVDVNEENGQETVRVSFDPRSPLIRRTFTYQPLTFCTALAHLAFASAGGQAPKRDAFRSRRQRHPRKFTASYTLDLAPSTLRRTDLERLAFL